MAQDEIDRLCMVTLQVEAQAAILRKLGYDETAYLLEMAVLDLNRQICECRGTLVAPGAHSSGSRRTKDPRH
jgi:hypothetical protein